MIAKKKHRRVQFLEKVPAEFKQQPREIFVAAGLDSDVATKKLESITRSWKRPEQNEFGLNLKQDITMRIQVAWDVAWHELIARPLHHSTGKAITTRLNKIWRLSNEIDQLYNDVPRDVVSWLGAPQNLFGLPFEPTDLPGRSGDLHELRKHLAKAAALIEAFHNNWQPRSPGAKRFDPFVTYAVVGLLLIWEERSGKRPSKSRTGPFAAFVITVWRLLCLPAPVDDDDIEEWLGARVEHIVAWAREAD